MPWAIRLDETYGVARSDEHIAKDIVPYTRWVVRPSGAVTPLVRRFESRQQAREIADRIVHRYPALTIVEISDSPTAKAAGQLDQPRPSSNHQHGAQGAASTEDLDMTPTQETVIGLAAGRTDHLMPIPANLKGGAVAKVAQSLIKAGYAQVVKRPADGAVGGVNWTTGGDGKVVGLRATTKAFEEAGVSPVGGVAGEQPRDATAIPKMREGTSQYQLVQMLKRPHGATVAEIASALGWNHDTVRGAISGALRKKFHMVIEAKTETRKGEAVRVYHLIEGGAE